MLSFLVLSIVLVLVFSTVGSTVFSIVLLALFDISVILDAFVS